MSKNQTIVKKSKLIFLAISFLMGSFFTGFLMVFLSLQAIQKINEGTIF